MHQYAQGHNAVHCTNFCCKILSIVMCFLQRLRSPPCKFKKDFKSIRICCLRKYEISLCSTIKTQSLQSAPILSSFTQSQSFKNIQGKHNSLFLSNNNPVSNVVNMPGYLTSCLLINCVFCTGRKYYVMRSGVISLPGLHMMDGQSLIIKK